MSPSSLLAESEKKTLVYLTTLHRRHTESVDDESFRSAVSSKSRLGDRGRTMSRDM